MPDLPDIPGAPVEILMFALVSLVLIVAALVVVMARDPFVSALSLLGNFVALGVMYLLLDQPFVAVSQILVYAGAVVVLFLFVIAYLGDRRELPGSGRRGLYLTPAGLLVALGLCGVLVGTVLWSNTGSAAEIDGPFGSPEAIGEAFLTTYLLEFEVTSLVLLVAAIGGIVLGLTGRSRHKHMRRLMNTRSADQHRRLHSGRAAGAPVEAPPARPWPEDDDAPRTKEPV